MIPHDDRRRSPRFPANLHVRFRRTEDGLIGQWRTGQLMTISNAGAFIRTEEPFNLRETVDVELPFPDEDIVIHGRVRWTSHSNPEGMGIHFEEIDDELSERIIIEVGSGHWISEGAAQAQKTSSQMFMADISDLIDEIDGDEPAGSGNSETPS